MGDGRGMAGMTRPEMFQLPLIARNKAMLAPAKMANNRVTVFHGKVTRGRRYGSRDDLESIHSSLDALPGGEGETAE